jgi:hypothetical protein
MSQENLTVTRRAFDAFTQRDQAPWSALCDPAIEAIPVGDWPEQEIRGRGAVQTPG